ncbi:Uncharacterized protein HA466_0281150 [Hirschfeldia incana]|nr:Uncharacterized protein HA466_0281150 [Hirschfeldia incana]
MRNLWPRQRRSFCDLQRFVLKNYSSQNTSKVSTEVKKAQLFVRMDPQHTGDLFKHLEKQNELLKEAHKTMSQEIQKLMVEEQMMMHKLYELTVTHRKNNKEMKRTQNVLEEKGILEEASSLAMIPTGDEQH